MSDRQRKGWTVGRSKTHAERRSANECVLKIGINSTRGINNRTPEQRSSSRHTASFCSASTGPRPCRSNGDERRMRRYVGPFVQYVVQRRSLKPLAPHPDDATAATATTTTVSTAAAAAAATSAACCCSLSRGGAAGARLQSHGRRARSFANLFAANRSL